MVENYAVVWIRDGVLVDRMPENAVAFALASLQYIPPDLRDNICIEDLINYGFEKSGVSVAEKMRLFNEEKQNVIKDIDNASAYYTALGIKAETSLEYFDGASELLNDLKEKDVKNYITSAVEQKVLDKWRQSRQGRIISDYLCEILGSRPGFQKGREHFAYIQSRGATRTYYVADAISEIKTGSECSDCGVIPIGFANIITGERVVEAFKRLRKAEPGVDAAPLYPIKISEIYPDKLVLPSAADLEEDLAQTGATEVIRGSKKYIMQNLRDYFVGEEIL